MKKILLFLLIPLRLFGQDTTKTSLPIDSTTKLVDYKIIEFVDGLSQKQLYGNAKEWIAKNFNSARNVTQMDDPSVGKIIVKAFTPYDGFRKKKLINYKLWFSVSITVKDNKYRFDLTDFETQESGESEKYPVEPLLKPSLKDLGWLDIQVTIEDISKKLTTSIRPAMKIKDDF